MKLFEHVPIRAAATMAALIAATLVSPALGQGTIQNYAPVTNADGKLTGALVVGVSK